MNNVEVIGIDHGWMNMKTVSYDQNIFSLGGGGVKGVKGGKLK